MMGFYPAQASLLPPSLDFIIDLIYCAGVTERPLQQWKSETTEAVLGDLGLLIKYLAPNPEFKG